MTRSEPQPQTGASLSATSRATSHAESSTTGATEIRPGVRTGDSGTNSAAATPAAIVAIIGIQNSQWKPSRSLIGPAITEPALPPIAVSVASEPTAPATR